MAIRSNGPLTECSTRTSAMRRSAASIGAALLGRERDQHVGAHQRGLDLVGHADRVAGDRRAARSSRSRRLCTVVRDSSSLRASSAVGARALSRSSASSARSVSSSDGLRHFDELCRRIAEIMHVVSSISLLHFADIGTNGRSRRRQEARHEEHPRHRCRQDRLRSSRTCWPAPQAATTASRWPTARPRALAEAPRASRPRVADARARRGRRAPRCAPRSAASFAVLSAAPYHLTVQGRRGRARRRRALPRPDRGRGQHAPHPRAGARRASTAFIPQCGLAPGFISIVAADLARRFDTLDSVRMRVGALPAYPSNALNYNLTWSTDGVINEYIEPCEAIVDGQPRRGAGARGARGVLARRRAVRGLQHLRRPRHAVPRRSQGQVRTLNYRTIRYPGHAAIMKALLHDLRLRDRRDLLKDILENAVPATMQDVVIIFVTVSGWRDGRLLQDTYARKIYSQRAGRQAAQRDPDHDRRQRCARCSTCWRKATCRSAASCARKTCALDDVPGQPLRQRVRQRRPGASRLSLRLRLAPRTPRRAIASACAPTGAGRSA